MEERLFIGFKLPRSLISTIDMLKSTIVDKEKYYNWVSGNNLHLTLLYLGIQNMDEIDDICTKIQLVSNNFNDFHITVNGTGNFSNNSVLFLKVEQEDGFIDKINFELRNQLDNLPKADENISRFYPHITIARKKKKYIKNKIDVKSFLNSVYFPMEFHIKYFTLFKSISTEKGVRYNKIKNFTLL